MCGEQLGTLAVKLYLLVVPDVYLGEVITVEISVTQDISAGENLLFLEFRLGPKHEPGFVEFLLLGSQGFRLRLVVGLQGGYIVIQFAYLLTFAYEFLVLLGQTGLQFLYPLCLLLYLVLQVGNGLLQLFGLDAAVAQLLLQLSHHVAVLLHGLLYEFQILTYEFSATGILTSGIGHRHPSLGL